MSEPNDESPESIDIFICGPQSAKCKCECSRGGPCEHKWDGETYTAEDGRMETATCSRCGALAIEHDMWVLP